MFSIAKPFFHIGLATQLFLFLFYTVKEKSQHTAIYVDFFSGDFYQIEKGVIALFNTLFRYAPLLRKSQ